MLIFGQKALRLPVSDPLYWKSSFVDDAADENPLTFEANTEVSVFRKR